MKPSKRPPINNSYNTPFSNSSNIPENQNNNSSVKVK
jgi:hypothetical protein